MGTAGGGTKHFPVATTNVQGATIWAFWRIPLPGYYGLSAGAWAHWARVWKKTLNGCNPVFSKASFNDTSMMNLTGIPPVSRWIDGVLEDKETSTSGQHPCRWFCGATRPTRRTRQKEIGHPRWKNSTLWSLSIPYPTVSAVMQDRQDGLYLLPATTQFETRGSVTGVQPGRCNGAIRSLEPLFGGGGGGGIQA